MWIVITSSELLVFGGEREKAVQQSLFPVYIKCSIFRRIWCQRQTLSSGWLCCSFSLFLLLVINLFACRRRATEEEKHELVLNPSEFPLHDNMIYFFFFSKSKFNCNFVIKQKPREEIQQEIYKTALSGRIPDFPGSIFVILQRNSQWWI